MLLLKIVWGDFVAGIALWLQGGQSLRSALLHLLPRLVVGLGMAWSFAFYHKREISGQTMLLIWAGLIGALIVTVVLCIFYIKKTGLRVVASRRRK